MNGSGSGRASPSIDDLALLHRLEQRRLRLRRRAVDLVGQQQVGEHRALAEAEACPTPASKMRLADDVGRHQVGRELHPLELEVERGGQRLHQQRLGHAGHALEQHVAADEQRGDEARQRALLADDDLADLVAHRQHGVARRRMHRRRRSAFCAGGRRARRGGVSLTDHAPRPAVTAAEGGPTCWAARETATGTPAPPAARSTIDSPERSERAQRAMRVRANLSSMVTSRGWLGGLGEGDERGLVGGGPVGERLEDAGARDARAGGGHVGDDVGAARPDPGSAARRWCAAARRGSGARRRPGARPGGAGSRRPRPAPSRAARPAAARATGRPEPRRRHRHTTTNAPQELNEARLQTRRDEVDQRLAPLAGARGCRTATCGRARGARSPTASTLLSPWPKRALTNVSGPPRAITAIRSRPEAGRQGEEPTYRRTAPTAMMEPQFGSAFRCSAATGRPLAHEACGEGGHR